MKLVDSYMYLDKLRDIIYSLLELRDRAKESGSELIPIREATPLVRYGFISMFKGGVIMDVTNEEQAR
ncbi:MAG: pyridoxal 5'-phosphate synthase lyase subunit PdxS, partial [Desulfurococcaceae archaeon]